MRRVPGYKSAVPARDARQLGFGLLDKAMEVHPPPGKSGTKKVDERVHFLSFSNFLIVLFRIFRESGYNAGMTEGALRLRLQAQSRRAGRRGLYAIAHMGSQDDLPSGHVLPSSHFLPMLRRFEAKLC